MKNFSNVCRLLATLFENYQEDARFEDLFWKHDIFTALPYFEQRGYVALTEQGKEAVLELWQDFIDLLGIEDKDYNSLEELVDA